MMIKCLAQGHYTAAASRFEPGTSQLRVHGLIHWVTAAPQWHHEPYTPGGVNPSQKKRCNTWAFYRISSYPSSSQNTSRFEGTLYPHPQFNENRGERWMIIYEHPCFSISKCFLKQWRIQRGRNRPPPPGKNGSTMFFLSIFLKSECLKTRLK